MKVENKEECSERIMVNFAVKMNINKHIFLLLPFLMVQMIYGQSDSTELNWNQMNENGERTGNWRKFYSNGQLRYKGQFKDGKEEGLFYYFDTGGNLKSTLRYRMDGSAYAKHYHKNKKLMAEGVIRDRKKDSVWSTYSENGLMIQKGGYISAKKYGVWNTYHDNGNISEATEFVNDVENGKQAIYFPDGSIRQECNYEQGVLEGLSTFYDADGNKILKGLYYHGSRDGRWIYYGERLKVEKVLEYDKGRLLNPEDAEGIMQDDSEMFRSNRKDVLEPEDLRKRIKYD